MPDLIIGCSGFSYQHWRGTFYPEELPSTRWFAHYCTLFASVELNVTFYRLVKPATFDHWRESTPPGFSFAVKGSRFITHLKRLDAPDEPLERFFAGVLRLEEKLFAVLWQFPPDYSCNLERLGRFLTCLRQYPVRNAFEFRHESWLNAEVAAMCKGHNVAICMADWPPFIADAPLTADFVYLRRHGESGRYSSLYTPDELATDAGRIRRYLATGRDVAIYFNNDFNGYAPQNAGELARLLKSRGGEWSDECLTAC